MSVDDKFKAGVKGLAGETKAGVKGLAGESKAGAERINEKYKTVTDKRLLSTKRYKRKELNPTYIASGKFSSDDIEVSAQRAEAYAAKLIESYPAIAKTASIQGFVNSVIVNVYLGKRELREYRDAEPTLTSADCLVLNMIYHLRKDIEDYNKKERESMTFNLESDAQLEAITLDTYSDQTLDTNEFIDQYNMLITAVNGMKGNQNMRLVLNAVLIQGIPLEKTSEIAHETKLPKRVVKREKIKLRELAIKLNNDTS